ncbi:MAG TPA: CHAT domain-containing protein [Pyrinomonadaceae bacterium]|nr:CHAT domain-containing protein [Pyrinomonadaceae bacterium]
MSQQFDESTKRDFLLGRLPAESPARRRIERRLVLDADFSAELDAAEDDLIDDYARGALSPSERGDFERNFLVPRKGDAATGGARRASVGAERLARLDYAVRLGEHLRRHRPPPEPSRWSRFLSSLSLPSVPVYAKALALALAVVAVGLIAWRVLRPSPAAEGLAALNAAYGRGRPVEARVTGLGYAELSETRGPEGERVDRQSLDLARTVLLRAARGDSSAQHTLGRLYLYERRFDDAVAKLEEEARQEPDDARLRNDLGAALLERGKDARRRGEEEKANGDFLRAVEEFDRAVKLDDALADALFNRALVYEELRLDAQAEGAWKDYLARDSTSPWADEARRRLSQLEERRRRGALEEDERFGEFVEAYRADDAERAWAPLGRSRVRRGNLIVERLLDSYLGGASGGGAGQGEALRMLAFAGRVEQQKAGDRFTSDLARFYAAARPEQLRAAARGRALMGEGYESFYKRSDFDEALGRYAAARAEFERAGDACEALLAEQWEGFCHLRVPDPSKGTAVFKRLAETAEASGYRALLSQSLLGLSDASGSADEPTQARQYAERAYELSQSIGHAENVARSTQIYSAMHRLNKDYAESLALCLRGIELALEATTDPKLAWSFYAEAGSNLTDLGLYGAALAFQQEALRLALDSGWLFIIERSYTRLGQLYMKMRDFAEAVRVATLAVEQGQRIEPGRSRDNVLANALLRLGHVYLAAAEPTRAVESYDRALELYAGLGLKIYDLEAHRGKLLAYEKLDDDAAAERELGVLLARLEDYRRKILEVRGRDTFFDTAQGVYDAAADFAYERRKDPAAAFDFAERSHARTLLDLLRSNAEAVEGLAGQDVRLALTTEPLGLEEIRARMPEPAQILQYHVLDDRLLVWLVSRGRFESREVPVKRAELEGKVKAYVELVKGGGDEAKTADAAKELYRLLVAPVESALAADGQLCVVADKSLHFLPFASLVSPASGRYLFEEHTLVNAPSASVFVVVSEAARRKPRDAGEALLAVGDPAFDREEFKDLPPLPGAEREARDVAALYGAQPLLGARADEEAVTRGMREAEVIDLASHYVIDAGTPMRSRLLLARGGAGASAAGAGRAADGVLQAFEVYRLRLPRARLVVLSACQTGGDRVYRGEGAVGIARPFIAAGASLVVASLWPAESGPTADLMVSFHRHRRLDGLPTAEAFRRAQLDMLNSPDTRNRQPRHWAAFAVTGGYAEF